MNDRFITLAIHTFERAKPIKAILEREGIVVELHNVNLEHPEISPGVRIRIHESDLPLALRIVENLDVFHTPEDLLDYSDPKSAKSRQRPALIVPVDFSKTSLDAAEVAVGLAYQLKNRVVLFNSFLLPQNEGALQLTNVYNYSPSDKAPAENARLQAQEKMHAFIETLRQSMKSGDLPPVRLEYVIGEGLPEEAILEYVRANPPQMVVMGTRSRHRKEEELIGSVTAEVLDSCRVPAFTIPEGSSQTLTANPEHVAFFCNLDQEDLVAIDALRRMFPSLNSHVAFIHIPERRNRKAVNLERASENLLKYCRENIPSYSFSFHTVAIPTMLDDLFALREKYPFSLICVPNRRRNVFARVFNPSLAHRVLFTADVPMLVVPV